MNLMLFRQPSAFLPLAMSAAALALVCGYLALFGVTREPDEGAAAHLFQLLMVAQMPIVLFFAVKWLPRAPWPALLILTLHVGAWLAAWAPIFYFEM